MKARIGWYLEVDMEGKDVSDALHRAEDALEIEVGKRLIQSHGPSPMPVYHGVVRQLRILNGHEIPIKEKSDA